MRLAPLGCWFIRVTCNHQIFNKTEPGSQVRVYKSLKPRLGGIKLGSQTTIKLDI